MPIADDWFNDDWFRDVDATPRDTDKPSDEDIRYELEPWDEPEDRGYETRDDSGGSRGDKAEDDSGDELLKDIGKWLDLGLKVADKVIDIVQVAKGTEPRKKPKPVVFDDIEIKVPMNKSTDDERRAERKALPPKRSTEDEDHDDVLSRLNAVIEESA
jgi:hypothetical protein